MDKNCQFCGITFQTSNKNKKYCSPVCRRSARTYRETNIKPVKEGRKCLNCKAPISVKERSDKLYCCRDCKNKAHNNTKGYDKKSNEAYFFEIINDLKSLVTKEKGFTYITLKEGSKIKINKRFYEAILSLKLHLISGYVKVSNKGTPFSLHRIVFYLEYGQKSSKKQYIDHINRDKLDNRIENLRLVNTTQNSLNRNKSSNKKTSKYKGVYPTASGKWQPQINYKGQRKTLGSYDSEEEAAKIYNQWAFYYYGSYAYLNEID